MVNCRILIALCILALLTGLLVARLQYQGGVLAHQESANPVVATIGTRTITLHEVEQAAGIPLFHAKQQQNNLIKETLQQMIDEELLQAEAARSGISVSQILAGASQLESIARLANLPAPVKRANTGKRDDAADNAFSEDPHEQARFRQALVVSLRRKTDIRIDLSEPELPVFSVSADDDPFIGPTNAPITIIEFSDFQCPYCKLSSPVLKEVISKYPEKIRLVYRDYPVPNHPHAPKAAEAAQCAAEQGQFWEYHDLLFSRQTPGDGWDYAVLAKELGLQEERFTTCLNTGRYQDEVSKDLRDALKLGITSTPTFFVNGRPLIGAQPVAAFQKVIDRILQQEHPSS
ncbi:thioredoxin domain-containing protein [Petrachloros mirabilis]